MGYVTQHQKHVLSIQIGLLFEQRTWLCSSSIVLPPSPYTQQAYRKERLEDAGDVFDRFMYICDLPRQAILWALIAESILKLFP
jgi:hypothetical protein